MELSTPSLQSINPKSSAMENRFYISLLFVLTLLLSGCDPEPEIEYGSLKIEVIVRTLMYGDLLGEGAEARLYYKDASCRSYRDALAYVAFIGEKSYRSKFDDRADSDGIVVIDEIPAGEYYLALASERANRYSEKVIKILANDTLELVKIFTLDARYTESLEPWINPVP